MDIFDSPGGKMSNMPSCIEQYGDDCNKMIQKDRSKENPSQEWKNGYIVNAGSEKK